MYAFIDETGNTGAKLLDDAQPLFVTGALMTRSDFDHRFSNEIGAIAQSIGVDELHANKLGVGRLEEIAGDVLKIVRKSGPSFFLARVEKRYVLASKVFDTLFDSFENKAVPWHIYNIRPLRIMMVFKVAFLLDDELVSRFWEALMEPNSRLARVKMAEFCQTLSERAPLLPDARSREVIRDALVWAAQNPEALEFVSETKMARRSHLPNMVGFGNLLSGIERQSNIWGYPVDVIRHDRQHEFAQNLEFWHQMFSNARPDVVEIPLGGKMVLRKVFGSKLEISSAKDSAGIQIMDIVLWLFGRLLKGEILPDQCQNLMDYVFRRAHQDDFSFAGVSAAAEEQIEQLDNTELPEGALEQARALQEEIEQQRNQAMIEYAQAKKEQDAVDPS